MLIYNELFQISRGNSGGIEIKDYVGGGRLGKSILIDDSATLTLADGTVVTYKASNYLTNYAGANSVITDEENAKINFQYGEQIVEFEENTKGEYKLVTTSYGLKFKYEKIGNKEEYTGTRYSLKEIYEKDPNGEYKLENGVYSRAEIQYNGPRFSKKGVDVYLLVTFNFIPEGEKFQKTIYKAIQYELVQEPIQIKAYNTSSQENNASNKYEVTSGNTYSIALNKSSTTSPFITANDSNFFKHVSVNMMNTIFS